MPVDPEEILCDKHKFKLTILVVSCLDPNSPTL